jgi:hypothetical protein
MNYLFPVTIGSICFWRYFFKGKFFLDDATLIGVSLLRAYNTIVPSKQKNIKWEVVTPKTLLIENNDEDGSGNGTYKKTNFAYMDGVLIAKPGVTENAVLIYELNGNIYRYNIITLFDEIRIDLNKLFRIPKDSLPNYVPKILAAEITDTDTDFSYIINQYAGPMGDFHGDKIKLCEMIGDNHIAIVDDDDIINFIDNNADESTIKGNVVFEF